MKGIERFLINPRFPKEEAEKLREQLEALSLPSDHVWMATSGSTALKWVALSHAAILASATAVNAHLYSDSQDIWLNVLPLFHVGGLGVSVRAFLSGAALIDHSKEKWQASTFHHRLQAVQATLTALVPAQLYDLVVGQFSAPARLRALIVGGGALSPSLYRQAVNLGWRVLPSYGMTECASQIATAPLCTAGAAEMPALKLLPHMEGRIAPTGHLELKSRALLTCYAVKTKEGYETVDPKMAGWFATEDRALLSDRTLTLQGRENFFIKIGGESSHLPQLEAVFEELKIAHSIHTDMALLACACERLGQVIHLVVAGEEPNLSPLITAYAERVLPFERIRKIHCVAQIPRTPLFKIDQPALHKLLDDLPCKSLFPLIP